jgi:hypothetical protein
MAKGNWSKYNPKVRCRFCGYVIKGDILRVDGFKPCCKSCFPKRNTTTLAVGHGGTRPDNSDPGIQISGKTADGGQLPPCR